MLKLGVTYVNMYLYVLIIKTNYLTKRPFLLSAHHLGYTVWS